MTNISSIAQHPAGRNDPRTGLGYGQMQNKMHTPRAVSSGEHGIYKSKGQWDNEIAQDKLKKKKKRRKRRKRKVDHKIDIRINRKLVSSQFVSATDSMPHHDKFSFVGAAGAGHTTLRAHDEAEGEALLEQFIQENISGNYYVRRSGKGNQYPKHNVTNPKASGQAPSYTRGGQYRTYKKTGNRFAVSGYTVNQPLEYFLYDDEDTGRSTWDEDTGRSTWDEVNPDNRDYDEDHVKNIRLHIRSILNLT